MKLVDHDETIVLVTGASGHEADARDRLHALRLQEEIDQRGGGPSYRRAVLVGDAWYLESPRLHRHPTIAVGGPGVNAVAQEFASALPLVWQLEQEAFIQADLDGPPRRACLWGANSAGTAKAVEAFVTEGWLQALLDRAWQFPAGELV